MEGCHRLGRIQVQEGRELQKWGGTASLGRQPVKLFVAFVVIGNLWNYWQPVKLLAIREILATCEIIGNLWNFAFWESIGKLQIFWQSEKF